MTIETRWWWVRHAPVTCMAGRIYGDDDPPCDTSNDRAFQFLAKRLPEDALWVTSHLQRTRQTAEAIVAMNAGFGPLDPLVERDLREQSFGDWQGKTYDEVRADLGETWHRFWSAPADTAPPGGESFADLMQRTSPVISRLSQGHAGRDIIAVAHGGTIRAALAHALGLSPELALCFAIDNCALTRISHFAGSPGSHAPDEAESWQVAQVNISAEQFD